MFHSNAELVSAEALAQAGVWNEGKSYMFIKASVGQTEAIKPKI